MQIEKRLLQKEAEFQGIINDVKRETERHYFGIDIEKTESPNILIFGESVLNQSQIEKIYESVFEQGNWVIDFNRLDCLCLHYDEAKHANLMERLKHNHYDAVILGSHPHST